jgi:hypothetical protein
MPAVTAIGQRWNALALGKDLGGKVPHYNGINSFYRDFNPQY